MVNRFNRFDRAEIISLSPAALSELSSYCKIYANGHGYFMMIESGCLTNEQLAHRIKNQVLLAHPFVEQLANLGGGYLYFCSNNDGNDFHQMSFLGGSSGGGGFLDYMFHSHESDLEDKPYRVYIDLIRLDKALLLKRNNKEYCAAHPPQPSDVLVTYTLVSEKQKTAMLSNLLTDPSRLVAVPYRTNAPVYLYKIPGSSQYISVTNSKDPYYRFTVKVGYLDEWKEIPVELVVGDGRELESRGIYIKFKNESDWQEIYRHAGCDPAARKNPYLLKRNGEKIELEDLNISTFDYSSIGITLEPCHTRITPMNFYEKSQRSALASAFHKRVGARSPLNQALLKNHTIPEPKILFKFFSLAGISLPAPAKRKRPRSPSVLKI